MDNIVGTFSIIYTLSTINLPEGKFFKINSPLLEKPVLARKQDTAMRLFYVALSDKYKWRPENKS